MRYKYRLIKVLILYYFASLARFGNVGARPGEDAVTGGALRGVRATRPGLLGGISGKAGARRPLGVGYLCRLEVLRPLVGDVT